MRYLVTIVLILTLASVAVAAGGIPLGETSLTANGIAYEINRDASGNLYLTDWKKGEVWRVAPGKSRRGDRERG